MHQFQYLKLQRVNTGSYDQQAGFTRPGFHWIIITFLCLSLVTKCCGFWGICPIPSLPINSVFNTAQSLFSGQRMEKQELSSQINFLCYFQSTNLKTRLLATHVWSYWQSAVHSIFYKKKHKFFPISYIILEPFPVSSFQNSVLLNKLSNLHPPFASPPV